jgi:hypothetical protein
MPVKVPNEYWVPEGNNAQMTNYQKKAQVAGTPCDGYGTPACNSEQLNESFIAAISGFNFLELGEASSLGEKKPTSLNAPWVGDFLSERSTSASVDSSLVTNSPGSTDSVPNVHVSRDRYNSAEQVWAMPPMAPKGYPPKSASKESAGSDLMPNRTGEPPRTTLMIRNIPRKYSQRQLLTDLNEAYAFTHGVDFFYLPTDLGTGRNLGYCFVNFLRPEDAEAVKQTLHKFRLFNAAKSGLSIGYADVQGFEQNLRNVRRSLMHRIKNREYRPLVAGPDGDLVPVTN